MSESALADLSRQPLAVLRRGHYLFASGREVPHPRRVIDAALLVLAAAGLIVASVVAANDSVDERDALDAVAQLLGWLDPVWSIIHGAAWVVALGIVAVSLIARRWRLARDLAIAVGLVALGGGLLGLAVTGDWTNFLLLVWEQDTAAYPAVRLAFVTAVILVARPDLIRPMRRVSTWLVMLAALAAIVAEAVTLSGVLGGLSLGLAAGALVRLCLGSSAGFPDADRVLRGLDDLGVGLVDLHRAAHQPPGVATYLGRDQRERPVVVKVYGSDARDAQFLAKVWRSLSYRDAGPAVGFSRFQQVEHESLLTVLAARAGVPVPVVTAAGSADSGDALLVAIQPDAPLLADLSGDDVAALLPRLWQAVGRLRADAIAHGRLNTRAIAVNDGTPILVDFSMGRMSAPRGALDMDVAELLVSTAVAVGGDRALPAALEHLGRDEVASSLPYLQRAALTPWLRDEVRRNHFDIEALRKAAAEATGSELPEVAELRRVSLRDIAFMALTAVAAYLLISQFADIGFDTIAEQLSSAQWEWLVVTLLIAQLILLTQAIATQGAVVAPLPYGPTVTLQAALKFISLTVPSAAGRIAVNLRYLQRLGVPPVTALASSALDGVAGSFVEIVLFLVAWPFVSLTFDLDTGSGDGGGLTALFWIGLALIVLGVIAAIIAMFLPRVRARIVPHLVGAWHSLITVLRSPRQLGLLLGGNLGNELVNAFALTAAVHAYGADVTIAEALIVAMGVTLFTSIIPVPGGIGVAEAGLTAGLVAVGIDEAQAFAAALTYRMATYYLPPIWGYFALRWLGNHGYV